MEYNSSRPHLVLKEYGRNVQKLTKYICEFEIKEERTKHAYVLVKLMKQFNPSVKEPSNDSLQRIWDHLHLMSNLELSIDAPYPAPDQSVLIQKPKKLAYHAYKLKHRHYGRNIELLIEKAAECPTKEEKEATATNIGKIMKTFYTTWNKEVVDGSVIVEHIKELSKGTIDLSERFNKNHKLFNNSERNKGQTNNKKAKKKKK